MKLTDEQILVELRSALTRERELETQLEQAREATRGLVRVGWARVARQTPEPSGLTWPDLEDATGLTRSGLRSRALMGTGLGPEEARRLAVQARAEATAKVNNPGRFDPATVTAAARLMGRNLSTFRRHATLNADGLVNPPEGGWPVDDK